MKITVKPPFAFEIKWQNLTHTEALTILEHPVAKSKFVEKLPKNTQFGIVAKSVEEKEKLRAMHFLVYDLDDF